MDDDVGIFRTTIGVAPLAAPRRRDLDNVMVDTGSEYSWIPSAVLIDLGVSPVRIDRFETADGRVLDREVGFALVYAGGRSAATAVVFAREGDMVLLGAQGLEGLNLRVDLVRRELVPAGPVPAAHSVGCYGSGASSAAAAKNAGTSSSKAVVAVRGCQASRSSTSAARSSPGRSTSAAVHPCGRVTGMDTICSAKIVGRNSARTMMACHSAQLLIDFRPASSVCPRSASLCPQRPSNRSTRAAM